MDNLYTKISLKQTVSIVPREINNNIDNTLLKKIKDELEGKCIKEGYIKPNSIVITSRGLGKVLVSHFNGSIIYHVNFVTF